MYILQHIFCNANEFSLNEHPVYVVSIQSFMGNKVYENTLRRVFNCVSVRYPKRGQSSSSGMHISIHCSYTHFTMQTQISWSTASKLGVLLTDTILRSWFSCRFLNVSLESYQVVNTDMSTLIFMFRISI